MRFQESAGSKPDTLNMPSLIQNRQNGSFLLKLCCKGIVCLPAVKPCLCGRGVCAKLLHNMASFPSVHKSEVNDWKDQQTGFVLSSFRSFSKEQDSEILLFSLNCFEIKIKSQSVLVCLNIWQETWAIHVPTMHLLRRCSCLFDSFQSGFFQQDVTERRYPSWCWS